MLRPQTLPGQGSEPLVVRRYQLIARVHRHETARAKGIFGHAGRKTGLAKQGRLLVYRPTCNGQTGPLRLDIGLGYLAARGQYLWQHSVRNVQQRQHVIVPGAGF